MKANINRQQYIEEITAFILKSATEGELDILDAAIKRRGRVNSPEDIKFSNLAQNLIDQNNFEMPDFHDMSRDMIKNIILENVEEISKNDLDILLDHYTPDPAKKREDEKNIPPEMLQSMIKQFIAFSVGRMDKMEEAELRHTLPNWPEKYWQIFSPETQSWIKNTIKGIQP